VESILTQTNKQRKLEKQIPSVAYFLLAILLIFVGAKADLSTFNFTVSSNREGLIIATFLILLAILGRVITEFAVFSDPNLNKLAIGVGVVFRGEVRLVLAGIGSAIRALFKATEAAIIVMEIALRLFTPPLLCLVFKETDSIAESVDKVQE
jgi:Kef-type K+ transport system membrane component KefB